MAATTLVSSDAALRVLAARLEGARRVAIDIESNGLFAYRARLCTLQLGFGQSDGIEVAIVDALASPLDVLASFLRSDSVRKVVHDVAFDARILAEAGLPLANVLDTSVAARMLGRPATGLASLLSSELGISLDKTMQHHDWAERPLDARAQSYLANDVLYLEALADKLWEEVEARGIGEAVEEETRYRVAHAISAAGNEDPRPAYVRLKGIDKSPPDELPILRRLAEIREERARELDVPPYKVVAPDVLFAIARARPRTMDELGRVRGALAGSRARSLAPGFLRAVASGLEDRELPAVELAMLARPRLPSSIAKERRSREQRLTKWRRAEAERRAVDEQVILPGHCLQDLAAIGAPSLDAIAGVPGIGAFRVARDGAALLAALTTAAEAVS